jgi:AcrR family transcriptional regulator
MSSEERPAPSASAPRARLNRERVLRAAVELADTAGIDNLSMRKLGQHLGVEAMSLYNHVPSKDDLLDGMVDLVFGEIGEPSADADWKKAMRQRALAVRAALARHAWAMRLLESRRRPGATTLRHHDTVIGCLRRAGFSLPLAAHAYSLLDSYIYGFVVNEQALPFESPEDVAEVGTSMLQHFPTEAYPNLAEFIRDHALQPGYNYGDEFAFGLDLLLDGLERALGESDARRPANTDSV